MTQVEDSSVLHALYKEASTRRRTANAKEAEVLAAESACRDATKLTAESALLTDIRLKREVEQAYNHHQLPGTGLLTKAQLKATLHSLGLLHSRPAGFSSTVQRTAAPYALPPSHAHCQSRIIDSLWHTLTCSSLPAGDKTAANHRPTAGADSRPRAATLQQQGFSNAATEIEIGSFDSLLNQSLDVWQQLTGEAENETLPTQAFDFAQPAALFVAKAQKVNVEGANRVTAPQLWHPPQVKRAGMHGVNLQQLMSFVQLVQQQRKKDTSTAVVAHALGAGSEQPSAELGRLARMCSQNKQANMAYIGIGNQKLYQQSMGHLGAAPDHAAGTQLIMARCQGDAIAVQQETSAGQGRWQPRGKSGKRHAAELAGNAVRFSRRQYRLHHQGSERQQQQQQQSAQPKKAHAARPKAAAGEELAKAQPFARSESTAAQVVKRRQAQAELEMVPCTFHPTLDPHSLALVAARAASYKAPHKAWVPYRHMSPTARLAHGLNSDMHVSSAGSAGGDSRQEPHAMAESVMAAREAMADTIAGMGDVPKSGLCAVASWDIQEQQALKECTFSPRLNAHNRAKSVVAQQWKDWQPGSMRAADQHSVSVINAADPRHAADAAVHHQAHSAATFTAADREADAVAMGADGLADGQGSASASEQHLAAVPAQSVHFTRHQAPARSKLGRTAASMRRGHGQLNDSYMAAACRGKRLQCAGPASAPADLSLHQQPACCDISEEQLQAEVEECDRRLKQHSKSQHTVRRQTQQHHQPGSAAANGLRVVANGSNHQESDDMQPQKPALKVALEAVLPDGSSSRFEVQQADQLRHLTKFFATMLELNAVTVEARVVVA